jgi:hypothetical protein
MSYANIGSFGSDSVAQSNPLSYCFVSGLDSGAYHNLGGQNIAGPDNKQCQIFTAGYCANNWDGLCEYASRDLQKGPSTVNMVSQCSGLKKELTKGEILIRNTAAEKYLKQMSSNCQRMYQPFDPITANSPLISTWVAVTDNCSAGGNCGSNVCIPKYGVDPAMIDKDRVMNLVLENPDIATDILVNIYNTSREDGSFEALKGTKLYNYFMSPKFQRLLGGN